MLHLLNPCKSILRQYYAKSCNFAVFLCDEAVYCHKDQEGQKDFYQQYVFFHIHMHKFRHYVYKKEDKRVRAISARPENDLMMMGVGEYKIW